MQKEKLDLILSIVAVSLFVLLLIVAAFILFRIYLKRKNMLLLEKERMGIQFEQTLLASKLEIQEQTFTYIGQEIHDNIGQVLSLVRINLNTLQCNTEEQKINLMDELLGKAITDLRSLSHLLDTDYIRTTGWAGAAEKLFLDLNRTGKYTTTVWTDENLPALATEKQIILFRMIQEIVNNIIKHAEATEINLHAIQRENQIMIDIKDNGKGFDQTTSSGGNGLRNLTSRAKMINAEINITSKAGSGTLVSISINSNSNE
jgi:signal transduction histidine kinase